MFKRPSMEILQNADDKIIPFLSMNYLAGAEMLELPNVLD